eukprot:4448248-Alexandrium_andersonii.AAC.1
MAEQRANADALNMHELQRELQGVEIRPEAAQTRLAEQAQQEIALVQNVFVDAEGRRGETQNRAQIPEQRLEVAAGCLSDNEELRERVRAKDTLCADVRRQLGEQRAAFEQQLADTKASTQEQVIQAINSVKREADSARQNEERMKQRTH